MSHPSFLGPQVLQGFLTQCLAWDSTNDPAGGCSFLLPLASVCWEELGLRVISRTLGTLQVFTIKEFLG